MSRRLAFSVTAAILAVFAAALPVSCATAPAAGDGQSNSGIPVAARPETAVVPDSEGSAEAPAVAGSAESPDSAEPAESPSVAATAGSDATGQVPAAGETGIAAQTENPETPAEDRFLYFYPEPELAVPRSPEPLKTESPQEADSAKAQPERVAAKPAVVPKTDKPPTGRTAAPAPAEKPSAAKPAAKPAVPAPATSTEPVASAKPAVSTEPDSPPSGEDVKNGGDEILPGIWLPETGSQPVADPDSTRPVPVPSRSASIPAGHTLEVWYPGSGWVYLGDASAQNGLSYQTRKLEGTDTLFSFRALKPGAYILEFSRFDVLGDTFVSDSLSVTVGDPGTERTGRIRAPDFRSSSAVTADAGTTGPRASSVSDSPAMRDEPSVGAVSAPAGLPPVSPEAAKAAAGGSVPSPEQLLTQTRTALAGGDAEGALRLLDDFFAVSLASLDEGWFLRGQAYEANGPARNVRKALSAYETLVTAFPDSARWREADARIRYIRQFYFRIR